MTSEKESFLSDIKEGIASLSDLESLPLNVPVGLAQNIVLRKYQLECIRWMVWLHSQNLGGILADEMGLGKTLQSIGFLLTCQSNVSNPGLVVVPLSVLSNWQDEFERFAPGITLVTVHGNKEERETQLKTLSNQMGWFVALTTYETVSSELDAFMARQWSTLIADEGHQLKNRDSVRFNNLNSLPSKTKFLLTGTPVQNNLDELSTLLEFVNPVGFKGCCMGMWFLNDKDALSELIAPFILRRKKDQVVQLPPRREIILYAPMSAVQKRLYKSILSKDWATFDQKKRAGLNNVLMQLKKCANHPYLFDGIEPEPFESGEHLIEASGKLMVLDQLLDILFEDDHRVLIFSQMTHFLDILQDYLTLRGISYERLDGSIRANERYLGVFTEHAKWRRWTQSDCSLTIQADTVIFMDTDFNPTADEQAAARVHRIGQDKETTIIRILCRNTVDEIIYRRAQGKLALQSVLGDVKSSASDLTSDDLMSIICFGLDKVLANADGDSASQEIRAQIEDALNSDATSVLPDTVENMYEFEGTDYKAYRQALDQLHALSLDSDIKRKFEDDEEETDRAAKFAARLKAKQEADHQKRLDLVQEWKDLGYESFEFQDHPLFKALNVKSEVKEEPLSTIDGSIQFLIGDVTDPKLNGEVGIICHVVDASGEWPMLGVFRAIQKLGTAPESYYKASRDHGNLAQGSTHFIKVSDTLFVCLIVAQRRRDSIALSSFETGLEKVAKVAKFLNASVHLPRIGDRLSTVNWYAIERIISKVLVKNHLPTFVYYFKRR